MVRITKKLIGEVARDPKLVKAWEVAEIETLLDKASKAYHDEGAPIFSDDVFDHLVSFYEEKAGKKYAKVGAVVSGKKAKVTLPYFMGSMDKIKGEGNEIANFKNKNTGEQFVIEDKLDGISALLHVKGGKIMLLTRGDGTVGQDITNMIDCIQGLPKREQLIKIAAKFEKKELTVRGELIMSREDFEKHLKDRGANARNLVSGSVNAKTPDPEVCARIQFIAYAVLHPHEKPSTQIELLKKEGFNVVYNDTLSTNKVTTEHLSKILEQRRKNSPFEVDGIIVIEDEKHALETDKNPTHAFAFKHISMQEMAEVVVSNVEWNVSKDGYLIPVVEFDPVKLAGVMVKRASGFNGEFIQTNKIGKGARITVTRSGDVIPYIVNILAPAFSGKPQMPEVKFTWTESGKDIIQVGESDALDQKVLENFFNKLDVAGLRSGTVAKLFNAGYTTIKSVVEMSVEDVLGVEGFKEKSAQTLVAAIKEKLSTATCIDMMDASNAFGRGFGKKRLDLIVSKFPQIVTSNFIPSVEDLVGLDGVSDITAKGFREKLPKYREFMCEVQLSCINPYESKPSTSGVAKPSSASTFTDQIVVFTGFRNAKLKSVIEEQGGKVADNMTKSTTILVTKIADTTSSKAVKARENGVTVLTMDEFSKKYKIDL